MLRNMAASLLRHETIRTTLPKAKELRRIVEPLITLGKADSDSNRRRAFAQLRDADVVVKLFESLGPRFLTRPGGYTRILRMDPRPGDAAPMALMQLLDQPEVADAPEADDEGTGKKAAPKAPPRKTSFKKRAVKTDEDRAAKKAKQASKADSAVKKADAKATAKTTAKKTAGPKKKAAAKKKSGK